MDSSRDNPGNASRPRRRRTTVVVVAVLLALLLTMLHRRDEEVIPHDDGDAVGNTVAMGGAPALAPNAAPTSTIDTARTTGATAPAPAASASHAPLRLQVNAPAQLEVGEEQNLVVSIAGAQSIGNISFTVNIDPAKLQLRSANKGDLSSNPAVISNLESDGGCGGEKMTVQLAFDGAAGLNGSGAIASVQFVADASGDAAITLSDVSVTDLAGRPIAFDGRALEAHVRAN